MSIETIFGLANINYFLWFHPRKVLSNEGWDSISRINLKARSTFFVLKKQTICGDSEERLSTILILFAFITENSSLEPLLEGVLSQIYNQFSAGIKPADKYVFRKCNVPTNYAKVTDESLKILQDPHF